MELLVMGTDGVSLGDDEVWGTVVSIRQQCDCINTELYS